MADCFLTRPRSHTLENDLGSLVDELEGQINTILRKTSDLGEDFSGYDALYENLIEIARRSAESELDNEKPPLERFEAEVDKVFQKRRNRVIQEESRFQEEVRKLACGEDGFLRAMFNLGEAIGGVRYPKRGWGKQVVPGGRFISFSNSSHPDRGFLYVASTPSASWKSPLCEPLDLTSLKAVLDQIAKAFPDDPSWATYQDEITTLQKTNPSREEYVEALEGMVDALLSNTVHRNTPKTAPPETPHAQGSEEGQGGPGRRDNSADDLATLVLTPNENAVINFLSRTPNISVTLIDLEAGTEISRKTLSKIIATLREKGLVDYPPKTRKGAKLTPDGMRFLEKTS